METYIKEVGHEVTTWIGLPFSNWDMTSEVRYKTHMLLKEVKNKIYSGINVLPWVSVDNLVLLLYLSIQNKMRGMVNDVPIPQWNFYC